MQVCQIVHIHNMNTISLIKQRCRLLFGQVIDLSTSYSPNPLPPPIPQAQPKLIIMHYILGAGR